MQGRQISALLAFTARSWHKPNFLKILGAKASGPNTTMQLWTRPFDNPIRNLITLFLCWKTLILAIACCSPGPGYDTSTSLALATSGPGEARALPVALQYIIGKLTRWDAIYFFKSSHRGYLFEQEWAFGWGFSRVIAIFTAGKKLRLLF
jgi:phosphatidylinositol glycan class V